MPLSWNEIKSRALAFSKHWADASNEDGEGKPFLIAFFEIFGITNKRIASFEHAVKKYGGGAGYVDLFWPGILLVEMKSRGKNLDRAHSQAMDYFPGIAERDLPRFVLVCDFARFRLFDLVEGAIYEFPLEELYKHVRLFGFIAGYQTQVIKPQDPINIKAAERMGRLHDQLRAIGYEGRPLELYLVRMLFCLFAEDTGIFEKRQFQDYIELRTSVDGADLAHHLSTLFYVLNTPQDKRLKNLDEHLAAFPYINGKLFADMLPPASFDAAMRESLLDLCGLDWGRISPAIFGSLFQSIMDAQARRNLGAHYTSEENILKLIKPLFLDALWAEFEKIRGNKKRLSEFHARLRTLTFFDPACGCGNFLVITYRELRLLELEVLRAANAGGQMALDVHQMIAVDVDQFFGIEIEDFPAQIAQVALWLVDHQMNMKVSEEFGAYFVRIPLNHSATIVHANALRLDWGAVLPPEKCAYLLGNPPFVGHQWRSAEQMADMASVWGDGGRFGRLDFVTCWHHKAVQYMKHNPKVVTALVSTNSICQGEQVGTLWSWMLEHGVKIHFAHRTFMWTSEARGRAAVHCVIVGFSLEDADEKVIFEYEDIKGEPHAIKARNINPYLVDAENIILPSRTATPAGLPQLIKGSQPTDGGHLILSEQEAEALQAEEPTAAKWLKTYIGGEELINGGRRYCLWLKGISPKELKSMPAVMKRVAAVSQARLKSPTKSVQAFADKPTLFTQDRQPDKDYLGVPEVSSERRRFIPIAFLSADIIASNKVQIVEGATQYHFGMLCSTMHNAWVRTVAGRLKSDYSYSPAVYNNFPWPTPTDKQRAAIEAAAQAVLDARAAHPDSSLADLYDPLTMPPDLVKAHQKLDAAVDASYGYKGGSTDAARVAFLFGLYQQLTSLLPADGGKPRRARRVNAEAV
ncbi:MAG: class I SAM-dependent DNA methyltransferase [Zoogloea sp.]|nr:class I SAM-dependent DNA methyltransferase [Zoogloea sp.]